MRRARGLKYLPVLYFLASAFIFLLDSRGDLGLVHSFAQRATLPFDSWVFGAKRSLFLPFSSLFKIDLEIRVRELEERNSLLLGEIGRLKSVEEENVYLRKLLNVGLPSSWSFALASVISKVDDNLFLVGDFSPSLGTPVLVVGEEEGFKGGVFVGRVSRVLGRKVEVVLPTNEAFHMPVYVRDKTLGLRTASGLAIGRGGKLVVDQILASEGLNAGDLVFTSGDEEIGEDLLVGYVQEILPTKDGTWQQVEVKLAVNVEALDVVFFLVGGD